MLCTVANHAEADFCVAEDREANDDENLNSELTGRKSEGAQFPKEQEQRNYD